MSKICIILYELKRILGVEVGRASSPTVHKANDKVKGLLNTCLVMNFGKQTS